MSYSFTLTMTQPVTPLELFTQAGFPDVMCREEVDLARSWPESVLHFYRPVASCRTIEVTRDPGVLDVRLMAYSSPDDYRLGIGLVAPAARQSGAEIRPEDGDVLSADDFTMQFDVNWIDRMVNSPFGMFDMALNQGGAVTIHGAIRAFRCGPDMLTELGFTDDRDGFAPRFFVAFHRSQWVNPDDGFRASVMLVAPKGSSEQKRLSSVGAPGLKYWLEKVDVVMALVDGDPVFISWDRLRDAFGDRLERIDEQFVTIAPMTDAEWSELGPHLQQVGEPLA